MTTGGRPGKATRRKGARGGGPRGGGGKCAGAQGGGGRRFKSQKDSKRCQVAPSSRGELKIKALTLGRGSNNQGASAISRLTLRVRGETVTMSGVLPTDKCKVEFAKLQEKRAYKFITFKIDPDAGVTDVLYCHEKTVRGQP